MEQSTNLNEVEQQQRLRVVELLLPHFGKSVDQLLDAATSIQEHIEGRRRLSPSNTGRTE